MHSGSSHLFREQTASAASSEEFEEERPWFEDTHPFRVSRFLRDETNEESVNSRSVFPCMSKR